MFKNPFAHRAKKTISIFLSMHKVAICIEKEGQSELVAGELIKSDADWPAVINKMVSEHHLQGFHASVVIGKDFYQTFDIDKPKLEEKELLATLPFSIKDLVMESIFDLVVDYYDKPAQVRKNDQITVVCIPKSCVIGLRDMLDDHELKLVAITTEEMAICQLFEHSEEANLLISQQEKELVLSVIKNGQLYFSLRIRGYNDLLPLPLEGIDNPLVDGLSLEIQRALDYINSQLRINAIGTLYLALQCPDINLLAEKLNAYINKNVKPFPEQYNYHFLLAYGGFNKDVGK